MQSTLLFQQFLYDFHMPPTFTGLPSITICPLESLTQFTPVTPCPELAICFSFTLDSLSHPDAYFILTLRITWKITATYTLTISFQVCFCLQKCRKSVNDQHNSLPGNIQCITTIVIDHSITMTDT